MRNLAEQRSGVTVKLKEINQKFANDSAIFTIITILSAIYVPGGFVAVSAPVDYSLILLHTWYSPP